MSLKQERIYGIDLLRIVSMLMVVALHILGQGGILASARFLSINYSISWFLEIAAYCAVNCYALISGYVGIKSKHKASGLMMLWLQVAFYSVIISAIMHFTHGVVDVLGIIKACLPVTAHQYWYFTAYFAMWFFVPLMNVAIEHTSRKQATLFLVSVSVILLPIEMLTSAFYMNGGYGVIWLCYLYLVGAYINKYKLFLGSSCRKWSLVYLVCIGLTFGYKITSNIFERPSDLLITYVSPLLLVAAISLLALFINIKIPNKIIKPIAFVSTLSFGVYLIHTHPLIFNNILNGKFAFAAQLNPFLLIAIVFAGIIGIFAVCAFIDYLRVCLFKVLRIKQLCSWIEARLTKCINYLFSKFLSIGSEQ